MTVQCPPAFRLSYVAIVHASSCLAIFLLFSPLYCPLLFSFLSVIIITIIIIIIISSSSSSSSIQMDLFSRRMMNSALPQVKYACLQRDLTDVAKARQAYSGAMAVGPTD